MEIETKIYDAAKDIFSTMVMVEISLQDQVDVVKVGKYPNSISGVVGFAGTHKGVLAIHLPDKTALTITSNFLGMDIEEVDADVEDAIGELANMLGGNVKGILSAKGRDIELSLPTVVKGSNYELQRSKGVDRYVLPLASTAGELCIELQLSNDSY